MTEAELQRLVETVSWTFFQRPFTHQAHFNRRLQTTGGRYHLKDHHLDFNYQLFQKVEQEVIVGIIKHELCHYHLHLQGLGFRHQDVDFKTLLAQTGGLRYAPVEKKAKWCYRCQSCGQQYWRMRRVNLNKFGCGHCRGKLQLNQSN
ncbi:MAG: SprT family protein [Enterococcus sp.]